MEIERKFTVKYMPKLDDYKRKKIEQGYLCTRPIVRIRRSDDTYVLTYKSKFGITESKITDVIMSNELEAELDQAGYEHLKEKIDHYLVCKTRYLIPLENGLTAELDIFEGRLDGLVIVEVEFDSEEAAAEFKAPEWFGEDVSRDIRYKNNYLAKLEDLSEFILK